MNITILVQDRESRKIVTAALKRIGIKTLGSTPQEEYYFYSGRSSLKRDGAPSDTGRFTVVTSNNSLFDVLESVSKEYGYENAFQAGIESFT